MSNFNIKSDYLIQKFLSNPKIFNKYFKNSHITSKKIIKYKPLNISPKKLIYNNLKIYNSSIKQYNSYIINSIIFDLKSHIVALFKEYLLFDETAEFLKRFYKKYESKNRLPQISDYYVKYTLISPFYFAHEGRIILILKKFLKRKKKYLEYIEDHESTILNQKNKKFNFNFEPIITKSLIESKNNSRINSTLISYINKSNSKMTLELTEFNDNNSKSLSQLINNSSSILKKNTPIKNLKTKKIISNNAQTYNESKYYLNNNNFNKRSKPKIEKLKIIELDKVNEEKKNNNNNNIIINSHNKQVNKDLLNVKKIFFNNNTSNSSKLNKRKNYIEFTDNKRKTIENDDLFEYKLKKIKNKINKQNILAYTTTNTSIKNINNNTNTLKSINTYNQSNKDIKQNNPNLIIKNIFTNKTLSTKNSTKTLKRIYSSNFKKIKNNIYNNNNNSQRNSNKNKNDYNYVTNSQSKDKNIINKDLFNNTSILHTIQNKKQLKKINLNLNVNFNLNINYLKDKICKSNGNSKSKKRLMLKEDSFKNHIKEKNINDKNDKKYPKIIYNNKINSNDNKIDMIYYQIFDSQNNKDYNKNNNHKIENSNRVYLNKKYKNNYY